MFKNSFYYWIINEPKTILKTNMVKSILLIDCPALTTTPVFLRGKQVYLEKEGQVSGTVVTLTL